MNWLFIIGMLLQLLGKLLEWLSSLQAKGSQLTARQQKKLNQVIHRMNAVKGVAVVLGCSARGEEPEDE